MTAPNTSASPLFGLGVVATSPAALEQLAAIESTVTKVLHLHMHGNWPDLDVRERSANYEALASDSGAIIGRYRAGDGPDDFVVAITYADRLTLLVTLAQAARCLGKSVGEARSLPGFHAAQFPRAANL